jgi:hypothetical protein
MSYLGLQAKEKNIILANQVKQINMKKKIVIISILIAGAALAFYSCTKENQVTDNKTEECVSCQDGLVVANRIKQFKERLETARKSQYKDGDEMTKGEAMENMEMLFNASHGFAAETYSMIQVDTVEFELPADEHGNVPATDVAAAYDEMYSSVKAVYDDINFADKHIVALILHGTGDNTVQAVSTTGNKNIEPDPAVPAPFEDCWWYGENQGMCDGTFQWEMDGGDTLANVLFLNRPYIIFGCPPTHHLITVPDYDTTFEGNGSMENGYMFYLQKDYGSAFTDDEKQLSVEEMNYWYNREHSFLFTLLPQQLNKPVNWVMTSIVIDGKFDSDYQIYEWIQHENTVEYGLVLCVPNNIIDPPSDL